MKRKKLLLIMLAMLSVSVGFSQTRYDIATKMNEAGEAMNAKKFAEATVLFQEAVKLLETTEDMDVVNDLDSKAKNGLAHSHRMQGVTLASQKNYEDALIEFNAAVKAFRAAGDLPMRMNSEGLISSCYTKMANEKVKVKDYKGAIDMCKKGLEVVKNDANLMILAAQCYNKAGMDDESIAMFDQVIALGKKMPRLRAQGEKATELLVNTQVLAASKLSDTGKKTYALQKIAVAEKYAPESSEVAMAKLSIYNKSKDYKGVVTNGPAVANLQTVADNKSDVNFMIGAAYVALGDNAKALTYYKKVTSGKYLTTAKTQITQINAAIAAASK